MINLPRPFEIWLMLAGLCAASVVFAAEQPVDSLLAVVEESPITFFDVSRTTGFRDQIELQRVLGSDVENKQEAFYEAVKAHRAESLERLIDIEVVYEEFVRKGFRLPDEIIMKRIDRRVAIESGGDWDAYEKVLMDAGRTLDEIKEDVRKVTAVDVYLAQQVDRKIHIAPADVYAHFQQNRERFRQPAEVRLQMIVINREGRSDQQIQERIDQVAGQLQQGADFIELAKTFSDSPGKDVADDFEWLPANDIQPAFREQFDNLRKGKVTGPFEYQGRSVFLRIDDVRGGAIPPFEEVRQQVQSELFAVERSRRYAIVLENLRRQTYIRRLTNDTE